LPKRAFKFDETILFHQKTVRELSPSYRFYLVVDPLKVGFDSFYPSGSAHGDSVCSASAAGVGFFPCTILAVSTAVCGCRYFLTGLTSKKVLGGTFKFEGQRSAARALGLNRVSISPKEQTCPFGLIHKIYQFLDKFHVTTFSPGLGKN
jgi:hypothetical protein